MFVTVIVYVITSPAATTFSLSAVLLAVYPVFCSTGTSISGVLSPTVATFLIAVPLSISSWVTVYVPVTVLLSPTFTVTSVFTSIISSTTGTITVIFPVFVTVIVYVITSPAATTFSLSAVFVVVNNGVSSTIVITSSSSSTFSGSCSGFSGIVSPET